MKIIALLLLFFHLDSFANSVSLEEKAVEGLTIEQTFLDGWKITEEEYLRFQDIKKNTPRGYYTPENPLIYLGMEAKSESEKKRYAMKVAQLEWENWQKVEAFKKAIQEASVILYGQGDIIDLDKAEKFKSHLASVNKKYHGDKGDENEGKLVKVLFVDNECIKCTDVFSVLYKELLMGDIKGVEVAFSGSMTDFSIKKWATELNIPLAMNESGLIVLRRQASNESVSSYPTVRTSQF